MKYSLLSLLLFAAVVGLSVALWMTRQENENLRAENRILKNEEIETKEAARPIVRKLPTRDPLTWRYRIYLPPGKLPPDNAWTLCHKGEGSAGQSRLQAGTFDITLKITEDPLPDGSSQWNVNIGDRYRTDRQRISADAAKRFRESYKWTLTPRETILAPNPAFIGLLKSEDVAVWIQPDYTDDIEIPSPESRWYDQR